MWCFMKIFFGPLGFSLKLKNVKKWPKIEICHTCKLDEYLEVFFENLPFWALGTLLRKTCAKSFRALVLA